MNISKNNNSKSSEFTAKSEKDACQTPQYRTSDKQIDSSIERICIYDNKYPLQILKFLEHDLDLLKRQFVAVKWPKIHQELVSTLICSVNNAFDLNDDFKLPSETLLKWQNVLFQSLDDYHKIYANEKRSQLKFPDTLLYPPIKIAEFEAYQRLFLHFLGLSQINYSQNFAEELQKIWVKLHHKNDLIYKIREDGAIETISSSNITKHSTMGGIDDFIIYKIEGEKKFSFNFITMKTGTSSGNEFYSYHYIKRKGNPSSLWYKRYVKHGLDNAIKTYLLDMLTETKCFTKEKIQNLIRRLLLRYRFVQDSVGGDFLTKFNQQSGYALEKAISSLLNDENEEVGSLDNFVNGLVKLNQLIEIVQNGASRKVVKTQNGNYTCSNELITELPLAIRLADKPLSPFSVSFQNFFPTLKIDETSIKVGVKGFILDDYSEDSTQYQIAKFLNRNFERLSTEQQVVFGPKLSYGTAIKDHKFIVKQITKMHSRIIDFLLSSNILAEICTYWRTEGMNYSFSTLSEDPTKISQKVNRFLEIYSVKPYTKIQHWDFPSQKGLSALLRIKSFVSDIWKDFDSKLFRVLDRKLVNNSLTSFESSLNQEIFEIGLHILKLTGTTYCLPGSGTGNAHLSMRNRLEDLVLTFIDENNNLITRKVNNLPNTVYYEFLISDSYVPNFNYYSLHIPFHCKWDSDHLRICYESSNDDLIDYWNKLLAKSCYNIPKSKLKKLRNGVALNQADPDLVAFFVIICSIFKANWDLFTNQALRNRTLRSWLIRKGIPEDVIEYKNNIFWFQNDNGEKIKVRLAIAKKHSNRNKIQSGPYIIPNSDSLFGKYVFSLQNEFQNLIEQNPHDVGVKQILEWFPKNIVKK